ncbi:MAG: flagellar biosynthesis anti-sigma factor FlgM [Defluviitaleaceae bacterium]|nr:flagellar biosynthesis anti-sigma factor FlgM [Defluviitaleaceae bacterium]
MKIAGINPLQGMTRPSDVNAASRKKAAAKELDSYTPSTEAKEKSVARRAYMATPDVRADRVASLMAQIEAGTYKVNPYNIASKMVDARV